MSTSRTAQRPSSVAYLPRSHRSPLSARTRAEAILPALALTLTYFKKLTLRDARSAHARLTKPPAVAPEARDAVVVLAYSSKLPLSLHSRLCMQHVRCVPIVLYISPCRVGVVCGVWRGL